MSRLTFTLRKPGQDHSAGNRTSWSTYQVHGVLLVEEDRIAIEWVVTVRKGEVDGMDVTMDVEELPAEGLELPLERMYEAKVRIGWWRPRLTLIANDLGLFQGIPGARGSNLDLFITREDRSLAVHVAGDINDAIRRAQETDLPSPLPRA